MAANKDIGVLVNNGKGGGPNRPGYVDILIWVGGKLHRENGLVSYVNGKPTTKLNVSLCDTNLISLREVVGEHIRLILKREIPSFSMYFAVMDIRTGSKRMIKIVNECDVKLLIECRDKFNKITVWVVEEPKVHVNRPKPKLAAWSPIRRQNPTIPCPSSQPYPTQYNSPNVCLLPKPKEEVRPHNVSTPMRRSPKLCNESPTLDDDITILCTQTRKSPSLKSPTQKSPTNSTQKSPSQKCPLLTTTCEPQTQISDLQTPLKIRSPRVKQVAKKGKETNKGSPLKKTSKKYGKEAGVSGTSKTKRKSPKLKTKRRRERTTPSDDEWEGGSSDSELSDLDVEFEPGEEELSLKDDEFFAKPDYDKISDIVQASVGGVVTSKADTEPPLSGLGESGKEKKRPCPEIDDDVQFGEEVDYDSEDLRSLQGSDDEVDPYPLFNPEVDFKGRVNLSLGLKFPDVYVLRKALRFHAIENSYDYYFLHNYGGRVTIYCRLKCDCPWDKKHGKIKKCVCECEEARKCPFKVYAVRISNQQTMQIKSLRLEHTCGAVDANTKVTSEWLADKYMDLWRKDPYESLKKFIDIVFEDTGVTIGYYKAWFARARAKLRIYGDCSDQYGRVHDYAAAIKKYNVGSTVLVSITNIKKSLPIFQRMYICFDACKSGFREGCRPLIGVDGCHLKGPWPGMILTAVGKDGNNNIYPIAWAVVEVEDKSSWSWFLHQLLNDIGFSKGKGLTIMSDRQKGLIDSLEKVCPLAEVRFCVRHIWANFKLHFSGAAFKDSFWRAARTSSRFTFICEMEAIKYLSTDAYKYLIAIPAKYWARHAFLSSSKSNMLLNNLCETFNGVIKYARDKPIITCMEWIRRYVMKRMAEKWNGAQTYNGKFMPYVDKVLVWVREEALKCKCLHSRSGQWEVDHNEDRFVVDIKNKTCSCYKWDLTGIPCSHAYACILKIRGKPEDYVDKYYSKEMFLKAYTPFINPMPGMSHWDPTDFAQPLPPLLRKMPGRPPNKKRKKEPGEKDDKRSAYVKRAKKQNHCSNCGQPGHYRNKCSNPPAPPKHKKKGGRPPSNDSWNVARRKKHQARVERKEKEPATVDTAEYFHDGGGPSSPTYPKSQQHVGLSDQGGSSLPKVIEKKVTSAKGKKGVKVVKEKGVTEMKPKWRV